MNKKIQLKMNMPREVRDVLNALKKAGYEAYIVGGCVRDALLGREPEDWDITTSALPDEVKSVFPHTADTGLQHGTVMVLSHGRGIEVTTFRVDGIYEDFRHPSSVSFTRSLSEDLKRRDFTINAFAWDENGLIDLFDGLSDLDNRIIRCVGDPAERFKEDALRIMRAVRFCAQLGFDIEEKTRDQIRTFGSGLAHISMERIRTEWEKTLLSSHPERVNDYADYGLAPYIIKNTYVKCFDRSSEDLLKELAGRRKLAGTELSEMYRHLLLAVFFEKLSPGQANEAFRYLKYDNFTRISVAAIIANADRVICPDRAEIKRELNRMGRPTFDEVMELRSVKEAVRGTSGAAQTQEIISIYEDIIRSGEPWEIKQLAVNGTDLIRAGIPAGKKIGVFLEKILQKVIQSPTLNNREILCSRKFLSEVENECKTDL